MKLCKGSTFLVWLSFISVRLWEKNFPLNCHHWAWSQYSTVFKQSLLFPISFRSLNHISAYEGNKLLTHLLEAKLYIKPSLKNTIICTTILTLYNESNYFNVSYLMYLIRNNDLTIFITVIFNVYMLRFHISCHRL